MRIKVGSLLGQITAMFLIFSGTQSTLLADESVTDQASEFSLFIVGSPGSDLGQEFVPSSNRVSFVCLATAMDPNLSSRIRVVIRQGSITNPVLGASEILSLTNHGGLFETNCFFFNPDVPVTPGGTYVLQGVLVDGDPYWWIVLSDTNTYIPGRLVSTNYASAETDLWFREGVIVPSTDPTFLSIQPSVDICWKSKSAQMYLVQYSSELTSNNWANLGPPIAGNGTTNCVVDPIANPSRLYRVVTLP